MVPPTHSCLFTALRSSARAANSILSSASSRLASTSTSSLPALRPFQEVTLPLPLPLVHGGSLSGIGIRVEVLGDPSLPLSRTVVIFPSFSHSSHVAGHTDDPSPGWWQDMVGPGLPIDTRHFRVICASNLGSPYSPTNPATALDAAGRPLRARFPVLTPTDLASCHAAVLARLFGGQGVLAGTAPGGRLHALIGASMGGMQALQFASLHPGAASRLLAVATTGRTTPFSCAIRATQRSAILADPAWAGGDYADTPARAPVRGLRLARELGTMFYRTRGEFDARFAWAPSAGADVHWTAQGTWEAEAYLSHAGAKFARAFDANSYLVLSKAMDLMDLGDGWGGRGQWAEGARRIASQGTQCLLMGVKQDALIPAHELSCLAAAINGGKGGGGGGGSGQCEGGASASEAGEGGAAEFVELDSVLGHDAFLVPRAVPLMLSRTRDFLEKGLEHSLVEERALVGGPSC